MKKLLSIILCCLIILSLVGCGGTKTGVVAVNVENSEDLSGPIFGRDALIEIGDNLYYDSSTRIVYWWNGSLGSNYATSPSPYYAPNGLPYRYNPETNTFEEIQT